MGRPVLFLFSSINVLIIMMVYTHKNCFGDLDLDHQHVDMKLLMNTSIVTSYLLR